MNINLPLHHIFYQVYDRVNDRTQIPVRDLVYFQIYDLVYAQVFECVGDLIYDQFREDFK